MTLLVPLHAQVEVGGMAANLPVPAHRLPGAPVHPGLTPFTSLGLTVFEAWTDFIAYYRGRAAAHEIAHETVNVYENLRAALGRLSDVPIATLGKPAVWAWLREFGQIPSVRTGRVRRAQGNAARHVLGLVCNYAELCGWRTEGSNPVRGVPRYRERPRDRFLSAEECQALFRALDQVEARRTARTYRDPLRAVAAYSATRIIKTLYLSGRRYKSIASLEFGDCLFVDGRGEPHPRPIMRCRVKGHHGKKTYPVASPVVAVLREQQALVGDLSRYVFPSPDPSCGWVSSVAPVWEEVCEVAGLRNLVLHGLRHTAACQLLANGVDRRDVARFLDDDKKILDKHYDHVQVTPTHRHAVDVGTHILVQLASGVVVDDGYRPLSEVA